MHTRPVYNGIGFERSRGSQNPQKLLRNGKRFVARADQKLTAFMEFESGRSLN